MNESVVKEIEREGLVEKKVVEEVRERITWLVFSILDRKYAIKSGAVDEIIHDVKIYRLPCLPSYVEGVMNRRGEPVTVLNPVSFIDEECGDVVDSSLFLVLKRSDDKLSLHISDILFFCETEGDDLHLIPNTDDERVVLGTIDYNHEEIPVLNPDSFEILLRKDLGS
ncbi:MAG: chemotaxis protein CheW [Treponema sp.]|nr:chemotaxis protein CheW [Treponema sp.]